jgi:chemotaxis response regulator CheB
LTHPDIILTFKKGLEAANEYTSGKVLLQVYAYDDPLLALSEFKPNFYDLLLVDVNMPKVNGFEFSEKILKLDGLLYFCRRNEHRSIKRTISNIEHWMLNQEAHYNREFSLKSESRIRINNQNSIDTQYTKQVRTLIIVLVLFAITIAPTVAQNQTNERGILTEGNMTAKGGEENATRTNETGSISSFHGYCPFSFC